MQGPLCVSQLLSHLIFLAANGGMDNAAALPDTFTTPAFVASAVHVDVPETFVSDMAERHQCTLAQGTKVFDLFRMWRLDSGEWQENAALIMDAWHQRCWLREQEGCAPSAPPQLMNSNVSSVDDVREVWMLALPALASKTWFEFHAFAFIRMVQLLWRTGAAKPSHMTAFAQPSLHRCSSYPKSCGRKAWVLVGFWTASSLLTARAVWSVLRSAGSGLRLWS